jgi:hypothetical protein
LSAAVALPAKAMPAAARMLIISRDMVVSSGQWRALTLRDEASS